LRRGTLTRGHLKKNKNKNLKKLWSDTW